MWVPPNATFQLGQVSIQKGKAKGKGMKGGKGRDQPGDQETGGQNKQGGEEPKLEEKKIPPQNANPDMPLVAACSC